jgi:hypothetical protein
MGRIGFNLLSVGLLAGSFKLLNEFLFSVKLRNYWNSQETISFCKSNFYKSDKKMQLCKIVYCSLAALRVSRDIFAHHQEHLNCNNSFWLYSLVSLSAADISRRQHT